MAVGTDRERVPRWAGAGELNPILATVTPCTRDHRVETGELGDYLGSALRRRSGLADPAFVKAALAERVPGFPVAVRPPLVAADDAQSWEIRTQLRTKILPQLDPS